MQPWRVFSANESDSEVDKYVNQIVKLDSKINIYLMRHLTL